MHFLLRYYVIISNVHICSFTGKISHVHASAPKTVLCAQNLVYKKLWFIKTCDVIIIHVWCNDVTKQKTDTADPNKLADDIIDISRLCARYGVKDIIVSSVLAKYSTSLTRIIRELNDQLKTKCQLNNSGFICNDNVTRDYWWKYGIHFTDTDTNILAGIFWIILF